MSETNKVTVRISATLEWPKFFEKDEMSDKYTATLTNLKPEAVKILEAADMVVRDGKKEGEKQANYGRFIKASSKYEVRVYDGRPDEKGNIPKGVRWDNQVRIGNGTKAMVEITAADWTYQKTKGRGAYLNAVKITELVELGGGDQFDADPF
tara:strand:+ start:178 stop:633 length:456 start_codon:yes stop_codon:yes gene_type:complete